MTLKEFQKKSPKEKCIIMWEWLAETGYAEKADFYVKVLGFDKYEEGKEWDHLPEYLCYACGVAIDRNGGFEEERCEYCPIEGWNNCCIDTPFKKWDRDAVYIETKKKYASKVLSDIKLLWKE